MIDIDSPKYQRRMVRELNSLPDGFYSRGQRFSRARFSKNKLQARSVSGERWTDVSFENINDAYGRSVTASRS